MAAKYLSNEWMNKIPKQSIIREVRLASFNNQWTEIIEKLPVMYKSHILKHGIFRINLNIILKRWREKNGKCFFGIQHSFTMHSPAWLANFKIPMYRKMSNHCPSHFYSRNSHCTQSLLPFHLLGGVTSTRQWLNVQLAPSPGRILGSEPPALSFPFQTSALIF